MAESTLITISSSNLCHVSSVVPLELTGVPLLSLRYLTDAETYIYLLSIFMPNGVGSPSML